MYGVKYIEQVSLTPFSGTSYQPDSGSGSACLEVATCSPGTYVQVAASVTSNAKCAPCPDGEFTDQSNLAACAVARTCDPANEHETLPLTPISDRQCALNGECSAGEYEVSAPTPNQPRKSIPKLLDLGRAPYVLYGVTYIYRPSIPSASTARQLMTRLQLDLGRAPYVLYGVKYIDLVSLEAARLVNLKF